MLSISKQSIKFPIMAHSENSIFKPWVPNWAIISILVFCMLHTMVVLGLYTSNITYAASYLDIEPEDLQFTMSLTYGTFLATIMIEGRLFRYFPPRNYFIVIYFLLAVLFIISAYTNDFVIFTLIRIIEGILMALPWIPLRILLLSRFKSKNANIIAFSLTYGALLIASPFIMNIVVWVLDWADWIFMVYISAFFQIICVGLILLTFNNNRFHRKLPLYQVDWASYVLLCADIICGAFVLVYGEKKYWFQSPQIIIATIVCFIFSALFILRQLSVKRPCFDMRVFQFANLRTGLLLFIIFYVARASLNICHTTMAKVWNWEPIRIANIQYLNALGDIIGIILAGILMAKGIATRFIFVIGFSLMAIHHLWFTYLFVPDINLSDIVLPYILQGIAVGTLFVPLVLFTVSSVPSHLAPFSGAIGVSGRYWGTNIGFCFIQNAQVFFQTKHYHKFRQFILAESPQTQERITQIQHSFQTKGYSSDNAYQLALQQINNTIQKQDILLSNMEIFTIIGISLLVVVMLILLNQHLRDSFNLFRNKVWVS